MVSKFRRGRCVDPRSRVLANAESIDGRKEWTCKFCSESTLWTRWRCRRCYGDIPAGLRGKHRQAVAARSGEWSTGSTSSSGEEDRKTRSLEAENKELRARIDALEKKGGDGVKGGQSIPSRKEGDLEDVWGEDMDMEDETESRKNWMSGRKKNCRESYGMSKDSHVSPAQESIKDSLKWRMHKWRQGHRACRQENKQEASMPRKQVPPVWRKCYKGFSHWERMEWRSCSKESEETWELCRSRCQEEKKEEGAVKMNKSKAESVSSWCHQRQTGSMKVLQRVVWSLIFLVFGVHLAKAVEQENQVH